MTGATGKFCNVLDGSVAQIIAASTPTPKINTRKLKRRFCTLSGSSLRTTSISSRAARRAIASALRLATRFWTLLTDGKLMPVTFAKPLKIRPIPLNIDPNTPTIIIISDNSARKIPPVLPASSATKPVAPSTNQSADAAPNFSKTMPNLSVRR